MKKVLCLVLLSVFSLTSCSMYDVDVTKKPKDTSLTYWVGEKIKNDEIDQNRILYNARFDFCWYLDSNYSFDIGEDGSKKLPQDKVYVYYEIEKYDEEYMVVSLISITDSNITVYGLSMKSSQWVIHRRLTSYGFIYFDKYSGREPNYTKDGLTLEMTTSGIAIYCSW